METEGIHISLKEKSSLSLSRIFDMQAVKSYLKNANSPHHSDVHFCWLLCLVMTVLKHIALFVNKCLPAKEIALLFLLRSLQEMSQVG